MITDRNILSNIAVCLVGTIVGAQIVACGGKPQPNPLAPSTPTAPASTTLVIGATARTTTETGIVRWEVSRIVDGVAANGVDSGGNVMTRLAMRGVDNQDGNGVVAELSTDGSILRVTKDGSVLLNEMAPAMFQYLGLDVQNYQAQNGASPSGVSIACAWAIVKAAAAGVVMVAACGTPPVNAVVCGPAVILYLDALQVEYSACRE